MLSNKRHNFSLYISQRVHPQLKDESVFSHCMKISKIELGSSFSDSWKAGKEMINDDGNKQYLWSYAYEEAYEVMLMKGWVFFK